MDLVFENNKNKNYNIADSIPFVKKHPYAILALFCLLLNFTTRQGSGLAISPFLTSFVVGFVAVATLRYFSESTDDFVLSPRGMLVTVPAFIGVIGCTFLFNGGKNGIVSGSVFFFALLLVILLLLKFTGRLTWQNSILLIFLTGFAIRVIYAMYTEIAEVSLRQHDVGAFFTQTSPGMITKFDNRRHAEYIEYIARYLRLPHIDPSGGLSQLYHPPLHHILSGVLLKINVEIGMDYKSACEGIQYLTVFWSGSCMITGYKIFRELGLEGKSLVRATALISLFPWFYLFAGGVNNDIAGVALGFLALYIGIKWYKEPSMRNIVCLALATGFAMFANLSAGLVIFALAFLFVSKFVSVWKNKHIIITKGEKNISISYILRSFASFAAIVLPLGLGWQIRNKILWNVPLFYSPTLSTAEGQHIGNRSVLERLFGFEDTFFQNPFVSWGNKNADFYEYNIFKGGFKTALFGETDFFSLGAGETPVDVIISTMGSFFCIMLSVFFLLLIVLSVVSLVVFVRKKCFGIDKNLFSMLSVLFVAFFGKYIVSCLANPFTCFMNFRYMVPCLFLPILVFSVVTGEKTKECVGVKRVFNTVSTIATKGFLISGAVVYVFFAIVQ